MKRSGRATQLPILFLLIATSPVAVVGQSRLPTTDVELARAERPSWVAALASACDTLPIDSTWRRVTGHYSSNASLPLPEKFIEQGTILNGSFYDFVPALPQRRYELFEYDSLTARAIREVGTATIRCSTHPSIWVTGYDLPSHPSSLELRGVWHVVGSWGSWRREQLQLHGMSRDLWGARALVTAMHKVTLSADTATKR